MLPTARKIDLYVKWAQAEKSTILYLAEKLDDVTQKDEPDNDELRKSYYEAQNLATLLREKIGDLSEHLLSADKYARELL
jgi:hypothetical protein